MARLRARVIRQELCCPGDGVVMQDQLPEVKVVQIDCVFMCLN